MPSWRQTKEESTEVRVRIVAGFFLLLAAITLGRLFFLQVIDHEYYALFAQNSHEISEKLVPHRGQIYFFDARTKKESPVAVNSTQYLVYGVPHEMDPRDIASTTQKLAFLLGTSTPAQLGEWQARLSISKSYYAPLAKKVSSTLADVIVAEKMRGIHISPEEYRFYPEESLGGNVFGFVGSDESGKRIGRYGLEQYFETELAGKGGFVAGMRGARGSWISPEARTFIEAEDGADLVLTIDRTLEFKACERLKQGLEEYEAVSGALVLMNAKTGAVLALCSFPDFDPNNYSKVSNQRAFNNTAVFTPYEPGSVFKPISMGAALDAGVASPNTTFTDPCTRVINGYTIRNADGKCYGVQTMTQVLENSVNTGMIWIEEKLGRERFKEYVDKFGFGKRTGITLSGEVPGDVTSLEKKGAIFGAVGSFGQGLTVTPLQIAAAYAAIASDGKLPRPYIVSEMRYPNGKIERTSPVITGTALSERSSQLLSAMLTSVVENHYTRAKIPGFYVAGKTGTAQIPGPGGYTEDTNHTFAGFAPATNPELVLVVKYEKPNKRWAEQTALYVFKDVLEFALNYYGFPHDKK